MSDQAWSIGVDLGGTNIKIGLIDQSGNVLFSYKEKTRPQRGGEAIVDAILNGIDGLLLKSSIPVEAIRSIGLGVPGTVDPRSGIVEFAPNLGWRDFELVKYLRQAYSLPVHIAQDTRAAAWSEFLVGAGRGFSNIASVTLGTGIGCGMVLNGRVFNGALNTAGEFGHMIVELNGKRCNCGRKGCLEAHAGGLAILQDAKRVIGDIALLAQKESSSVAVEDVFDLSLHGHPQAREITDRVVNYVGMGLVNLINLNSLELVSISGGISNAPDSLLLDPLIRFVQERAYDLISSKVRICKSVLGEDAPVIGAALLYCDDNGKAAHPR
jgi:glucokinase